MPQTSEAAEGLAYRPEIDVLRAAAVLAVIGFHAFPHIFPGGFVGVDVFFVISGYLITRIIHTGVARGDFRFGEFYERRVRRIIPPMLLVTAATLAVGWYLLLRNEYPQLGKHAASGTAFLSNFLLWHEAGYFDIAAARKPLLHLWSLSVEEQFYLLWPVTVVAAMRWKKKPPALIGAAFVLSFAANVALVSQHPAAAFYSPAVRFWEFMVGAGIASYRQHIPNRCGRPLLAIGGGLVIAPIFMFSEATPYPGLAASVPVLGAAAIIAATHKMTASKLLAWRPFVYIGKISYPLYLWHWPLLAFAFLASNGPPDRTSRIACVCLAFALAAATYHWFEPLWRWRRDGPSLHRIGYVGCAVVLAAIAAWSGVLRPRLSNPALDMVADAKDEHVLPQHGFTRTPEGATIYSWGRKPASVIYFGDSHAEQFAPRVARLADNTVGATMLTMPMCSPISLGGSHPTCEAVRARFWHMVSDPAIKTVVIMARWGLYVHAYDQRALKAEFRRASVNHNLFIVLDEPAGPKFDPHTFVIGDRWRDLTYTPVPRSVPKPVDLVDPIVHQAALSAGAQIIDVSAALCPNGRCMVADKDGRPIYRDDNHLRTFFIEGYAGLDETIKPPTRLSPR